MHRFASWKLALALCASAVLVGCGGGGGYREVTDEDLVPKHEEHDHHHAAPHGGLLVEVGSHEYNVEVVVAEEEPRLTLYILDAHAEGPVAIKTDALTLKLEAGETETAITLKATPQTGEAEGTSSQFVNEGPLPEGVKSVLELHGDLSITIGEKTYNVHVSATPHEHDHKH